MSSPRVVPIDWDRFRSRDPLADAAGAKSGDYRDCRQILQNNCRYELRWMEQTFPYDAARRQYEIPATGREDDVRAPASAACGLAVALTTDAYDEAAVGCPRGEAIRRTCALLKGVAAVYAAAGPATKGHARKGWGNQWQSAFWAAQLGQAGWMLWDHLDAETRRLVASVVVAEADRFIAPGYRVPYWAAPDGHINFPGDTKAEENAWNATILQAAVAMMPAHPHAAAWKRAGSELMVSAFARRSDLTSTTVVDGKPVRDWLHGFNVADDGGVINHNRLHPDYMATPTLNLQGYLIQSLAGQTVSQAADFNADFVYRTLAGRVWPSPPWKAPGGTMYQPGSADLYYPQGTDWSVHRYDIYYLYDAFAWRFGWGTGLAAPPVEWMRLRAGHMLAMQARSPEGRMYAPGEFATYKGAEQIVAWQMGEAFLLHYLAARQALSPVGNWLDDTASPAITSPSPIAPTP